MTGILKITDANIIGIQDTDCLFLCLIPAGNLKFKKSEYEILRDLFNENIEVIDIEPEPEPPSPDQYISRSEIPEYLWKFIKYTMTKPANITADSYLNLCRLLQALPQRMSNNAIFNWTDTDFYALQLGYNSFVSITSDGYYLKNGQVMQTRLTMNPRTDKLKFRGVFKFTSATSSQTIFHLADPSNVANINRYMTLRTGNKTMLFQTKASTVGAGNCSVTLTSWDISQSVSISLDGNYDSESGYYDVDLNVRYHTTDGYITNERYCDGVLANRIPNAVLVERIASFVYRGTSATVNTTVSGNKYFQDYNFLNETTGKNTIIKFDDSKIIDDKLLVIV